MIARLVLAIISFFSASPLLSPLLSVKPPDLTPQLQQKISLLSSLDYSAARTLPPLSDSISYLVYNSQTFQVYAAKNPDARISPASFTKLLTAQVALDVSSPKTLLTATPRVVDLEPSILGVKAGEKFTLAELVRAAMSTSANDAAAIIAEGVAETYRQDPDFFLDLMNQKAALLGMSASRFTNSTGYDDPNQSSTLEDIARLVHNTKNYPLILVSAAADRKDLMATATHGFYYLPNWNGLLGIYPGVDGLKIAYTETAGYSTIVTAKRENIPVMAILTGADSIRERDLAAANLLDAAFMAEHLPPANISRWQLQKRYNQWAELIQKTAGAATTIKK